MKPDPSLAGLKCELEEVAHGNRAGHSVVQVPQGRIRKGGVSVLRQLKL